MSAALNFNDAIKKRFGDAHSLEKEQAFSIQSSTFDENAAKELLLQTDLPPNIRTYITDFEKDMTDADFNDPRFSFRVAFIRKRAFKEAATAKVTVQNLRRNVSVLWGAGGNIAVLTGPDGKLLVDAEIITARPHVSEALASINADPIEGRLHADTSFKLAFVMDCSGAGQRSLTMRRG